MGGREALAPATQPVMAACSLVDDLFMVGWSHRHTELSLLERVTVTRKDRAPLLARLCAAGCTEAVLLSTCSRTEVYGTAPPSLRGELLGVFTASFGTAPAALTPSARQRSGYEVVEHLFAVTAGLDSRVVGEVEIRDQVRQAVREAQAAGTAHAALVSLFATAVRRTARIRAAAGLETHGRSLAVRAVDLGLQALGDVRQPVVLIVGSGRMAAAAVQHLADLGHQPQVAARDHRRAAQLAGTASTCSLPSLADAVAGADLVICATAATQNVVTTDHVRQAMAARRCGLTVVDLSVPRNVDVAVGAVDGVQLIDVEGLHDDSAEEPRLRAATAQGRVLVREEAQRYVDALGARRAGLLVAGSRQRVEEICLRELTRLAPQEADREELRRAARSLTGKLMHRPTVAARAAAAAGDVSALQLLCDMYPAAPLESRRKSEV